MVQGMLSGGQAGLVSIDILRKEQEENRRRAKQNKPLEGIGLLSCYSNIWKKLPLTAFLVLLTSG